MFMMRSASTPLCARVQLDAEKARKQQLQSHMDTLNKTLAGHAPANVTAGN